MGSKSHRYLTLSHCFDLIWVAEIVDHVRKDNGGTVQSSRGSSLINPTRIIVFFKSWHWIAEIVSVSPSGMYFANFCSNRNSVTWISHSFSWQGCSTLCCSVILLLFCYFIRQSHRCASPAETVWCYFGRKIIAYVILSSVRITQYAGFCLFACLGICRVNVLILCWPISRQ